jgi:very-short-patch-repair endonuclease
MSLPYEGDLIKYAKELRKNATPWERKLWHYFLKDYSVRFQRQKVIGKYIVDFYCSKAKLAIELDGGGHFTDNKIDYDNKRTENLEKSGIKVIRFYNTDVDGNFYEVCSKIDREVKSRLTSPQSEQKAIL